MRQEIRDLYRVALITSDLMVLLRKDLIAPISNEFAVKVKDRVVRIGEIRKFLQETSGL